MIGPGPVTLRLLRCCSLTPLPVIYILRCWCYADLRYGQPRFGYVVVVGGFDLRCWLQLHLRLRGYATLTVILRYALRLFGCAVTTDGLHAGCRTAHILRLLVVTGVGTFTGLCGYGLHAFPLLVI